MVQRSILPEFKGYQVVLDIGIWVAIPSWDGFPGGEGYRSGCFASVLMHNRAPPAMIRYNGVNFGFPVKTSFQTVPSAFSSGCNLTR
jgi:hypothetical protein